MKASFRCALLGLTLALPVWQAAPVQAQITAPPQDPFPDWRKFASGVYADAEMGTVFFLGEAYGALGPGVAFGARVGYDIIHYVSVQLHGLGSSHRTDFGNRPQSGQLIQLYQATAELKLSLPVWQIRFFFLGGAGVGYLSTNLLESTRLADPDSQTTLLYLAGAGVDYHTLSRHFSFGLQGLWSRYQQIESPGGVIITAYARYTF